MPKSKREQKVTLSKTQKKGRVRKESLMEEVRACVDQYQSLYVFTATNMRNAALKDVRASLKSSRIFFGRNKLIAAALGRTASDEFRDGMSKVSSMLLGGEAGLLAWVQAQTQHFTDSPKPKRSCKAAAPVILALLDTRLWRCKACRNLSFRAHYRSPSRSHVKIIHNF